MKREKMNINKIEITKIAQCVLSECIEGDIDPYIISLALSFGCMANEDFDTPSLIISVATEEEVLEMKKSDSFKELIWNQAEYDNQEMAYECIEQYFGRDCEPMQEYFYVEHGWDFYINLLLDVKEEFRDYFVEKSSLLPIVYVQEITDDATTVIEMNFTEEERVKLKELGLL